MVSFFNENSAYARQLHIKYGHLGQLLFDPNTKISVRRCEIVAVDQHTQFEIVFDKKIGDWILFEPDNIVPTYSFAVPPENVVIEMDYFLRSLVLPKHKYIWVTGNSGIPHEYFEMVKSSQNQNAIGRFTFAPMMGTVQNPAKMSIFGFMEQDQADFIDIFSKD